MTFIDGVPHRGVLRMSHGHHGNCPTKVKGQGVTLESYVRTFYGLATLCDEIGHFSVSFSFQKYGRPSQLYFLKSQQCGQSVTHDERVLYSPAIFVSGITNRNIQRRILIHTLHDCSLHIHYHTETKKKKIG